MKYKNFDWMSFWIVASLLGGAWLFITAISLISP